MLVRRHSAMVFSACRRLLSDSNDAEDAFQAAFLILARKAGSIARAEVVAGWLHRVAVRSALHLRAARKRRARREEPGVERLPSPALPGDAGELAGVLDEEIGNLPPRNRKAFILCCLEGKSGEEAARMLGCPPGTVSSRLTRARERLRERLTRRGFAPAAAIAALAGETGAAVPPPLLDSTLAAALNFSIGSSISSGPAPRSVHLAQGVLRAMTMTQLRFAALFLCSGILAATGAALAGALAQDAPRADQPMAKTVAPRQPNKGEVPKPEREPKTVELIAPEPDGPNHRIFEQCRAEAILQSGLHASAAGYLKDVRADIGDRVKKGQLLAEIDAPALAVDERLARVAIEQAKGALREAEANVMGAKADVAVAEANLRGAVVAAKSAAAYVQYRKKMLERMKALAVENAVDGRLVDEAEGQVLAATEAANSKEEAVNSAKADINVKRAKLLQAEAPVATAKLNVEAATLRLEKAHLALAAGIITAPFDGVVTLRTCSQGDYVRPDMAGARAALFTLVRTDVIRVVVEIPEKAIPRVEPGFPVDVSFDALPGKKFTAKVSRIGFVADPGNHRMRAEIDVANPDAALRPGMTGNATISLGKGTGNSLWIPRGLTFHASGTNPDGTQFNSLNASVYVAREGKAWAIPVMVGLESLDAVEIISGLEPGDRLILGGFRRIYPGELVRPAAAKK